MNQAAGDHLTAGQLLLERGHVRMAGKPAVIDERGQISKDRRLLQAKSSYAVIAVATMAGVGLNFTPLGPVRALYWCAVVNGVLAAR